MEKIIYEFYKITDQGDVFNTRTNKKLRFDKSGSYDRVTLCNNGKCNRFLLHRLVAESFLPNPLNKPQVNHKDFNKRNNSKDNLEWVTAKENAQHAYTLQDDYPSKLRNLRNKKPIEIKNGELVREFESLTDGARWLFLRVETSIETPRKLIPHLIKVAKGDRKTLYGFEVNYL